MKIVYWSGSGNTEKMANLIAQGIKENGVEAQVIDVSHANSDIFNDEDIIILGCPAMGAEMLEESEFEPMFMECEPKLKGKKIALFGSYGWGDGEWMRIWEETCIGDGAVMACDFVICQETPDEEAESECKNLGKALI